MTRWKTAKLGDLVTFKTGKIDSNAATPDGEYPFFTCSQETLRTDTYAFDTECVLLAGNNANGIYPLKYYSGKFNAYQRTYVVRSQNDERLINSFLFFALQLKLDLLRRISTGAATKFLTLTILKDFDFELPPVPTQRKIAGVLSAYDELIENNTRRIKLLEQIAQALYHEWFVRPCQAGKLPKGWETKKVTEAVYVNPPTPVPKETKKPYVPMDSLSTTSMLIGDFEIRTGNSGSKYRNGDTLFARITPCLENGKTAFVQFLPSDDDVAIGSTEFIVLRSRTLCPEYGYLMARSDAFRDNAIKSMSGASGRQRVQEKCFEKFLVAQPDAGTLEKFVDCVRPMFRLIHSLAQKNANLRRTRDLLLPKLISGEVDVDKFGAF